MTGHPDDRLDPLAEYREDIVKLMPYLPWLEQHSKEQMMREYADPTQAQTFTFPVYDSNLLNFVKAASKTKLVYKNYPYVYSKFRIQNAQDELRVIKQARPQDIDNLRGILSNYIIKGRTKGTIWPTGVANGVYAAILNKLRELYEYGGNVLT
ncbi:MAG: DUF6508 domain-containing protein [Lachnospiraceae bacterium]|nr:DUF6508 domain-containing protein [Lachnospiraceae bacterium]